MRISILLLLVILAGSCFSQRAGLSPLAEVSVLTMGPHQSQLYTAFGHSAFRVYDPVQGIDDVYNYGIFSFSEANFYLDFTLGNLNYKLGVIPWQWTYEEYTYYNRFIHEQKLNLTPAEKDSLYAFLTWNALPENQRYQYDYFYDNCATRIRDVLVRVFPEKVAFDTTFIKTEYTIGDLTDSYLKYQPWGNLGIDICLGIALDKRAKPLDYMFIPDYVEAFMDHATITDESGNKQPLVKEKVIVYEPESHADVTWITHPLTVFMILLLLAGWISWRDIKKNKISKWLDYPLLIITSILGLLILFLWFGTAHKSDWNHNLLWALPTNLIAAIAMARNKKWLTMYFFIVTILLAITLLGWRWLPNQLNHMLIPFIMTLGMRAWINYYVRRKQ